MRLQGKAQEMQTEIAETDEVEKRVHGVCPQSRRSFGRGDISAFDAAMPVELGAAEPRSEERSSRSEGLMLPRRVARSILKRQIRCEGQVQ